MDDLHVTDPGQVEINAKFSIVGGWPGMKNRSQIPIKSAHVHQDEDPEEGVGILVKMRYKSSLRVETEKRERP